MRFALWQDGLLTPCIRFMRVALDSDEKYNKRYAHRRNGINLAELYLRLNRSVLDESQIDLLTRMSVARYSFLHVDAVEGADVL